MKMHDTSRISLIANIISVGEFAFSALAKNEAQSVSDIGFDDSGSRSCGFQV